MITHEDIIKSLEVGKVKFIGVTEAKINGESKNVIIKFEGAGGKFTYEQFKGYKNAQFECSVKEKDGELWNATIFDENDPFDGDSDKLYKHIVKSSMNLDKCSIYPELINNKIKSEMEEVAMKTKVKYKIGDKVVINKDLVVGEWYGNWCWSDGKEYMKEKDYVVIDEVYDLNYRVENGKVISHEMIDGLYEEEKDMNIEDLKKQIEHYFNKNVSKIGDVILDSKSRDKFNVKYINEYEIELQEKKVKINKFLLDLLKLDDELKSMVNYK